MLNSLISECWEQHDQWDVSLSQKAESMRSGLIRDKLKQSIRYFRTIVLEYLSLVTFSGEIGHLACLQIPAFNGPFAALHFPLREPLHAAQLIRPAFLFSTAKKLHTSFGTRVSCTHFDQSKTEIWLCCHVAPLPQAVFLLSCLRLRAIVLVIFVFDVEELVKGQLRCQRVGWNALPERILNFLTEFHIILFIHISNSLLLILL